ncbi:MAG: T9SS type A sorting domain-containing protein [Bacteroidetes bacterium]|nr:T9SS type A sorting domain-containing protein [Bacteroidota bacterium]
MKHFVCLFLCFVLANTSNAQKFEWAKHTGTQGKTLGAAVDVDKFGNIYVAGTIGIDTIDFDLGPGTAVIENNGPYITFIKKMTSQGQVLWVKAFQSIDTGLSTPKQNAPMDIRVTPDGNIIIVGNYRGGIDFDTGIGEYILANDSNTYSTGYVAKLNTNGDLIWAKHFDGGVMSVLPQSVEFDNQGAIWISGYAQFYTFSNGVSTNGKCFLAKLDVNGDLLLANSLFQSDAITSPTNFKNLELEIDKHNNIYISGLFNGSARFDPNSSDILYGGAGDVFIVKYDSAVNYLWAKDIGTNSADYAHDMKLDFNGNVYVMGTITRSVDFDPGQDTALIFAEQSSPSVFLAKYDTDGQFLWVKGNANANIQRAALALDKQGNSYLACSYSDSTDLDPGVGVMMYYTPSNVADKDMYIQKFDYQGNFVWVKVGAGPSYVIDIVVDSLLNIYATGQYYNTLLLDAANTNGTLTSTGYYAYGTDYFTAKFSQDSCANFALKFDSVTNISCTSTSFASVQAISGTQPFTFLWNTTPPSSNPHVNLSAPGIYSIVVRDSNLCSRSASVLISGPSQTSMYDLDVNVIGSTFRPGFVSTIWLDAHNHTCAQTNAQLIVELDSAFSYISSTIAPSSIVGNTITWDIDTVVYGNQHFAPKLTVSVNQTTVLGSDICVKAMMLPMQNDVDTVNNIKNYCFTVIGSYDPNDKQVYPAGACEPNYTQKDGKLVYTVRFQNTGTASAINVFIVDTIRTGLDISTASVLSTSHDLTRTEIIDSNSLKFVFDNINLPDSNSNEPLSHGYVVFEVSPTINLPEQSIIQNSASIYFDYNEPIKTNTTMNTMVSVVQNCITVGLINVEYNLNLQAYPNPTLSDFFIEDVWPDTNLEFEILDYSGRIVSRTKKTPTANNLYHVDLINLESGAYVVKVITAHGELRGFAKVIKQ